MKYIHTGMYVSHGTQMGIKLSTITQFFNNELNVGYFEEIHFL